MSPIEQEELRRQGFGPKPSVNEDYKNPVASAVLHRIMMQHPGVLATHGPEHVMQAVDELADTVMCQPGLAKLSECWLNCLMNPWTKMILPAM